MVFVAILIGCIIGAIIGANGPVISYEYSGYLAIAIIAALDSVFGGITSVLNGKFDLKIFISGFFGNAILSIMLTWLGVKLNVDIYLAAIVVFVGFAVISLIAPMLDASVLDAINSSTLGSICYNNNILLKIIM